MHMQILKNPKDETFLLANVLVSFPVVTEHSGNLKEKELIFAGRSRYQWR